MAVKEETRAVVPAVEAGQVSEDDTRRDTPFKAMPGACFADTGGQERDDTRRDTPEEG